MKLKSGGSEGGASYDIFEVGIYVAVKYQPGINLKMLLWLFWLDEKKTEVLRNIFKENSIMPVNGDLRLSNGGIIPVNTIIKVNKKYISPASTKKTSPNSIDIPTTKSKDTLVQKPTTSANVWDKIYARLGQVLSTKRKQYLAIAGGVLLVSSLGIGTAVAVSQIIDPPKKAKKVEVAEVDEVSDEADIDTETPSTTPEWEKKVALQISEDTSESTTTTWGVPAEVPTSQNSPDTPKTESKVPQGGMAKDGTFVFTSKTKAADLREILVQFNAAEQSKKKK